MECVPRGVTAAFTARLRRLTHPGTSVELWGSPLSHSFRSSGDLTQSGHLICSSDHSVAAGHTGLRQVVTRTWYRDSSYSSSGGLRRHGVAARANIGHWGWSRTPRSEINWLLTRNRGRWDDSRMVSRTLQEQSLGDMGIAVHNLGCGELRPFLKRLGEPA